MTREAHAAQDDHKADQAWSVHTALLRTERANPTLVENPFWTVLRQDAFENFMIAFGTDQ